LILDTSKIGYLINKDRLPHDKSVYLIYAEHVIIEGDIQLHGKDLILCCSRLSIKGRAHIDTSGETGAAGKDTVGREKNEDKNDKDKHDVSTENHGGKGGKGGNVFIFVQELENTSTKGLTISVRGGLGGRGADVTEPGKTGGAGGDGGRAGKSIQHFSVIRTLLILLCR
jgi:hypothetical protein